jgi:hypothetical protein
MKITSQQLRKIIAEEVKRATLKEELGYGTGSAELQTMLDAVCDGWKSQFDPKDPSMDASGGKQVWEAQCDSACEVLGEKIEELIMQVEEDLHLGQFYSETGMPFSGKYRE